MAIIGLREKSIFNRLETLTDTFVLTGSRFFTPEQVKSSTDYDFFTVYSNETMYRLSSLGFILLTSYDTKHYQDQGLQCIMRYKEGSLQIDIQLYKLEWIEAKSKAQTYIAQMWSFLDEKCKVKGFWRVHLWSKVMGSFKKGER